MVERATGRAVCLALARGAGPFRGAGGDLDRQRQAVHRSLRQGRGGVVRQICRRNGIAHLLTAPFSPNQNGKVERFHGTFRPDFLDDAEPFTSVEEAQAAVDAWVGTTTPSGPTRPSTPGSR